MLTLQAGSNTQIDADAVSVAMDWPIAEGTGLEASTYLLAANGKVRGDHDMVFFNQPNGGAGTVRIVASDQGSIRFEVDLSAIPAEVERIVYASPLTVPLWEAPHLPVMPASALPSVRWAEPRWRCSNLNLAAHARLQ